MMPRRAGRAFFAARSLLVALAFSLLPSCLPDTEGAALCRKAGIEDAGDLWDCGRSVAIAQEIIRTRHAFRGAPAQQVTFCDALAAERERQAKIRQLINSTASIEEKNALTQGLIGIEAAWSFHGAMAEMIPDGVMLHWVGRLSDLEKRPEVALAADRLIVAEIAVCRDLGGKKPNFRVTMDLGQVKAMISSWGTIQSSFADLGAEQEVRFTATLVQADQAFDCQSPGVCTSPAMVGGWKLFDRRAVSLEEVAHRFNLLAIVDEIMPAASNLADTHGVPLAGGPWATKQMLSYGAPLTVGPGVTVTASSSQGLGLDPENLLDDDPNTVWHVSVAETQTNPISTLTIDLGPAPKPPAQAILIAPNPAQPIQFLRHAVLEGSADGARWQELRVLTTAFVPQTGDPFIWSFVNSTQFRFYRVTFRRGWAAGLFLSASEVRLYSSVNWTGISEPRAKIHPVGLARAAAKDELGARLFPSPGGSGRVTASSAAPGSSVRLLADGDPASEWRSAGTDGDDAGVATIMVDLGATVCCPAAGLRLVPSRNAAAASPTKSLVQGSHDLRHWEDIARLDLSGTPSSPLGQTWAFTNEQKYRYYRLILLERAARPAFALAEIGLFAAKPDPGDRLPMAREVAPVPAGAASWGRPDAVQSSDWTRNGPAADAVDGQPSTAWRVPAAQSSQAWIVQDFGPSAALAASVVAITPDKENAHLFAAADIEASQDGSQWTSLARITLPAPNATAHELWWGFPNSQAFRFYRLVVRRHWDAPVGIAELRFAALKTEVRWTPFGVRADGAVIFPRGDGYDTINVSSELNRKTWAGALVDTDPSTYWHRSMSDASPQTSRITIDLKSDAESPVAAMVLTPRQDVLGQFLSHGVVTASQDGSEWQILSAFSLNNEPRSGENLVIAWLAVTGFRYYELVADKGFADGHFLSLAEIALLAPSGAHIPRRAFAVAAAIDAAPLPPEERLFPDHRLRQTIEASGYVSPHLPGLLADDDPRTYWVTAKSAEKPWLMIDLGYVPDRPARVIRAIPAPGLGSAFFRSADLAGSADGIQWEPLARLVAQGPAPTSWRLSGTQPFRFYRLTIREPLETDSNLVLGGLEIGYEPRTTRAGGTSRR